MSKKLLIGLAIFGCVLWLAPAAVWAQETCDPEIQDCSGGGDQCDPEIEDCGGGGECDPEIEDCGGGGECDPEIEDCGGGGECDPEIEDCGGGECDPEIEDCGGGECDPEVENSCGEGESSCIVRVCNPETRQCESHPVVCEQDDDLCTVESCVEELGRCASGPPRDCNGEGEGEGEGDECSTLVCQPESGECEPVTTNPPPEGCEAALCRTPGFYGAHADDSKKNSHNITQAIITAGGGSLAICGETITNTAVDDDESAVEALCVSVEGAQRLQLARQLTAAALNCIISGGDAACNGVGLFETAFQNCNAACANSGSSVSTISDCIGDIDCLNNGGVLHPDGFCQQGTCSGSGEGARCNKNEQCVGEDSTCVPLEGTCHDQALVNADLGLFFNPPGPASSQKQCNDAIKNDCDVVGLGQLNCTF